MAANAVIEGMPLDANHLQLPGVVSLERFVPFARNIFIRTLIFDLSKPASTR